MRSSGEPQHAVLADPADNQQTVAGPAGHVAHLPPMTSKWNKIEPLLFSGITLNWLGAR